MKMVITASVVFVVQDRTDPDDDNRRLHRDPSKLLELMDSDGFRQCFVSTIEEAEESVRQTVEDGLGLSGGVMLGHVSIETKDIEGEGS